MSIKVKQVLEGNVLRKSQGELKIEGFETANIIHITFGDLTSEQESIELPDGTLVPTGIEKPGEFEVEIQLAHEESLNSYLRWAMEARDRSTSGVSPQYKRNGTIEYHRLFSGGGSSAAGRAMKNERNRVTGMWVKSFTLPGAEMDSTEDNRMSLTICYDALLPLEKSFGD